MGRVDEPRTANSGQQGRTFLHVGIRLQNQPGGKRCQQAAQVRFTADVRASLERLFPGREPCGLCDEWRTLSHLVYGGVEKAV